jgi:hypothetical protein
MDKAVVISEIKQAKKVLMDAVNGSFNSLITVISNEQTEISLDNCNQAAFVLSTEHTVPITIHPSAFVGTKPVAVIINGEKIDAPKWTSVYKEIIMSCNQDPVYHDRLLYLRGRTSGKVRAFVSSTSESMTRPIKIDENLFVESHYGSQTLMHILLNRILEPIGYDYTKIQVILK